MSKLLAQVIKRVLFQILLLWLAFSLSFFLIHGLPGDPAETILGQGANPEDLQRLRQKLDLEEPLFNRYLQFIRDLVVLNLGTSLVNNKKVTDLIGIYFPNTLWLAMLSLFISIIISIPLGTISALKNGSLTDSLIAIISSLGMGLPNFLLGFLLILIFSVKLGLFPVSGSGDLNHLVLPSLTLGLSMSTFLTRIIRTAIVNELSRPYLLFARAKGLSRIELFCKHLLKNIMIPVVTTLGMQFGMLLSGVIVTETVFSWPGIGSLLVKAIRSRDYPLIQGLIIFIVSIYLILNLITDLVYLILDPRIKYGNRKKI